MIVNVTISRRKIEKGVNIPNKVEIIPDETPRTGGMEFLAKMIYKEMKSKGVI